MIKMIVTDVDGTIVDKDEILHEEFVAYVKHLKANGIRYTIATGRAAGLAEDYVKRMEIEIPYIACNGGTIIQNGQVLVHKTIPLWSLKTIFETADSMGMSLMYSIDGVEYAYRETPYVLEQQKKYNRYQNPAMFSTEEWEQLEVDKVIVMAAVRDGSIGKIEELCKELPLPFWYKRYANKAIDILHCDSTKEAGLRELAKLMGIGLDEILFAGDDLNDIEAIKEAGVGVAVGNAQPPTREAADYVANENCYLGVMEASDHFTDIHGWRKAMDGSLRRQSYSLPGLLNDLFDNLKNQAEQLFTQEEAGKVKQIILTGCGDSYAAGLTLAYALEDLTGVPVDLVTALDFSRYYSDNRITAETLVIVVSISGNGVRIKEDMVKANRCGAVTLAVSKNSDSDIGKLAQKLLQLPIPSFERGPGNRNYFASLLALLLLGIHVGQAKGVQTEADSQAYYREIRSQAAELEHLLPMMDEPLFELAKVWKSKPGFDLVGSGMEYGSAWFGHAKLIEITGAFSMHINAEEWFHMNNFVKNIEGCGTIFLASVQSPGFSRTKEAVQYAKRLGRPVLVITDGEPEDFGVDVMYVKVPHSDFAPAMALTQYVPVCILAGYMGAMLGERNCRGCLGPWEFAAGGAFIRNSEYIEYEKN